MGTAAHAIDDRADFANPNIVKVVLDAPAARCTSRARRFRGARDAPACAGAPRRRRRGAAAPHRPVRLPRRLPAPLSARWRTARSRRSSRSSSCACCGTASASRCTSSARARPARRRHAEDLERALRRASSPADAGAAFCLSRAVRRRARVAIAEPMMAFRPYAAADPTSRRRHEIDPAGRPRRGQRNAGRVHLQAIRHSADLHRRHAARRRQGRHAARPGGQEGDGLGRPGQRRHHHRPGQGAHRRSPIAPTASCSTASRAPSRRPTR